MYVYTYGMSITGRSNFKAKPPQLL